MTLPELYEQQKAELEQFKIVRDKVWLDLQQEQQEITTSFGSKDRLPDDMRQRMARQISDYHQEWGMDTGQRHQEIILRHEQQREAITGRPAQVKQPTATALKKANDNFTEKQEQLQKVIRQQQAIRKRQQERKRKR